jgi:hypothetical protein
MDFVAGLQHKRATASAHSMRLGLPVVKARRIALVELADPKHREGGWFELAWRLRSACSVVCSSLSRTRCKII